MLRLISLYFKNKVVLFREKKSRNIMLRINSFNYNKKVIKLREKNRDKMLIYILLIIIINTLLNSR